MMQYDINKYLRYYPNIHAMIEDVPRQLWKIFLPNSEGGLPDKEVNVMLFKKRSLERERVIALQRLCNLPFKPNETLNVTEAKARIQGIKNIEIYDKYKNERDS